MGEDWVCPNCGTSNNCGAAQCNGCTGRMEDGKFVMRFTGFTGLPKSPRRTGSPIIFDLTQGQELIYDPFTAESRRPTLDETYMEMCYVVAKRSKDKSTKLGAVIIDPNSGAVVSTGYNGFPRGVNDSPDYRHERPEKYEWVVHAEMNAILNAARLGHSTEGCTLYCPWHPCSRCAGAIVNAGIKLVIVETKDNATLWSTSQAAEHERARAILWEGGVGVRLINSLE